MYLNNDVEIVIKTVIEIISDKKHLFIKGQINKARTE